MTDDLEQWIPVVAKITLVDNLRQNEELKMSHQALVFILIVPKDELA